MKLQQASNAALVITCLLVIASIVLAFRTENGATSQVLPPYGPGDRLDDSVPADAIKRSRRTLIVYEHGLCPFCRDSLPFYHRLQAPLRDAGVRLVAVTYQDLAANSQFLLTGQVHADALISMRDTHLKVSATPTLILTRKDGFVLNSWVGRLSHDQEGEVLRSLNAK
jgi:thiol-disulfide isomerase/thioredoxin